jgi:hypothetical protein
LDLDVRLFGTPTTPSPAQHAVSGCRKEDHYLPIAADCKADAARRLANPSPRGRRRVDVDRGGAVEVGGGMSISIGFVRVI